MHRAVRPAPFKLTKRCPFADHAETARAALQFAAHARGSHEAHALRQGTGSRDAASTPASREFDAGLDVSTGARTERARRNFRSVAKTR